MGALDGHVYALVSGLGPSGRISSQAERVWTSFAAKHGATIVRAADARSDRALPTHLVLVDRPASRAHLDARVDRLPIACRLPNRAPLPLLHASWFVESIKANAPLPHDAHRLDGPASTRAQREPLAPTQPRAERDRANAEGGALASPERAARPPDPRAALIDALEAAAERQREDSSDPTRTNGEEEAEDDRSGTRRVGDLAGCVSEELALAARSIAENVPANATPNELRAFVAEGFPGFVGRTHVAAAAAAAAASFEREGRPRVRRRARDSRASLSDLPDEVLARCLAPLPMLDLISAAATCRRLDRLALGARLPGPDATDSMYPSRSFRAPRRRAPARWPSRRPPAASGACSSDVLAVRVMTWNLRNNDPDPELRFANQPGAGEANGGWHWHQRVPVVARVLQRDAPHVLCLQEDTRAMARELMASEEMRRGGAWSYACFPPPHDPRDREPGSAAKKKTPSSSTLKKRTLLDARVGADGLVASAAFVSEEARALASRAASRWEQCAVWWREDAFEFVDGGQFEWVDGRALQLARGGPGGARTWRGGPGGARTCHMCPLTWVALRASGGGGVLVACSTHFESGHDWASDVPAKRSSAACVRAAVAALQDTFGRDAPVLVAGDFNAQKTQWHRRMLTGEGAGWTRELGRQEGVVAAAKERGGRTTEKGRGGEGSRPFPSDDDAAAASPDGARSDGVALSDGLAESAASDLVDVFAAVAEDVPDATFMDTLDAGVRTGGHRGTTWHNWRGPKWACMVSARMAEACKHHAQLAFEDRAELADDPLAAPPTDRPSATAAASPRGARERGVGGGFGDRIGGVGVANKRVGAVGHQRHIDHVYVARGEGVRDANRGGCRVRAVRAFVAVDCASEDVREAGEARCACGAADARVRAGAAPYDPGSGGGGGGGGGERRVADFARGRDGRKGVSRAGGACACGPDGVWASDHFPVVADLRVSWRDAEAEPRSRPTRRDAAHSPERAERLRSEWAFEGCSV